MAKPSLHLNTRVSLETSFSGDDPLASVLRPPPGETPEERARRLSEEEHALQRSKAIDDAIAADRKLFEKRAKMIKVLLLGQAESGKSTTLKNFQLTFAPAQFHAECSAWRAVVQLNLISSVRTIIDALHSELADAPPASVDPPSAFPRANVDRDASRPGRRSPSPGFPSTPIPRAPNPSFTRPRSAARHRHRQGLSSSSSFSSSSSSDDYDVTVAAAAAAASAAAAAAAPAPPLPIPLTTEHRKLIMRLGALLQVERLLACAISPGGSVPDSAYPSAAQSPPPPPGARLAAREFFVRAGDAWKGAARQRAPATGGERSPRRGAARARGGGTEGPMAVLAACCDDVVALWTDPVVREVLKKRKVDLESSPGFFLNDAARIARTDYKPTTDDILRARLQTLGVEEHHMKMETRTSSTDVRRDWIVYDVSGYRGNRHKWIPYFEDVDAIIFLAPLVFTQTLQEDPSVNRVEDSIMLWKKICANALLARATIVLFLNKIDLVAKMIARGARLCDYVPSYADQPDELGAVVKYFRSKFKGYQKTLSPAPRSFYCHETSVTDSKATSAILMAVREGIVMHNLRNVGVL